MGIQKLEITGYRSFESAVWEPGSLNLLVGPNGSGKSNLLTLLELIAAMARGELRKSIDRAGGIAELAWNSQAEEVGWSVFAQPGVEAGTESPPSIPQASVIVRPALGASFPHPVQQLSGIDLPSSVANGHKLTLHATALQPPCQPNSWLIPEKARAIAPNPESQFPVQNRGCATALEQCSRSSLPKSSGTRVLDGLDRVRCDCPGVRRHFLDLATFHAPAGVRWSVMNSRRLRAISMGWSSMCRTMRLRSASGRWPMWMRIC